MTRVYYREAVGALIVFDVTRASTFDAVLKWKDDLDIKVTLSNGKPVPAVLLANKSDQSREGLRSQIPKLETFCKENGFVGWFETSAKVRALFCDPEQYLTILCELLSRFMDVHDHPLVPLFSQIQNQDLCLCSCLHLTQIQQECIVLISRKAIVYYLQPHFNELHSRVWKGKVDP